MLCGKTSTQDFLEHKDAGTIVKNDGVHVIESFFSVAYPFGVKLLHFLSDE